MGKASKAVALFATIILAPIVQAQSIDVGAAKKDGNVVVYGSVVPQAMEALHKSFEKNTTSESIIGAVPRPPLPSARKQNGAQADRLSTS